MLNMDVEEARSGWNNLERGFTTTTSDRWKGGVFDQMGSAPAGRVPFKAKGMAERVESSPIKHSAMRPGTERITTNPTAMTMASGTRAGATRAIKPPVHPFSRRFAPFHRHYNAILTSIQAILTSIHFRTLVWDQGLTT
jgi:hypothetical protein